MPRPRHTLIAVAACALVLVAGGCTASKSEEYGAPQVDDDISIEDYANVTAKLDTQAGTVALPLDPFDSQTPEIQSLVEDASLSVSNQCLRAHGIEEFHTVGDRTVLSTADNTYFFWGLRDAQNYGFNTAPGTKYSLSTPKGDPATVDACDQEGREAIAPFDPLGMGEEQPSNGLDLRIRTMVRFRVTASSEFSDAAADISDCLKKAGFAADDKGRLDEQYRDKPLAEQVPVATAAANCAVDTGAIQAVYDLQARYEAAYIDRYEAQLAETQKHTAEAVPTLTRMIADANAGTYTPQPSN